MKMSEYFNLFDFNYNSLSDSKIKQLVDLMEKNMSLIGTRRFSIHVNWAFITPSKRIIALRLTLIQHEKIPWEERS